MNYAGLVSEKALITVVSRDGDERVGMRIAVRVGLGWRVSNGVAAGRGGLGGFARGLAERFERRWKRTGAVFVCRELTLESADGFEGRMLRGGTGIFKAQRKSEPNDGPYSGDGDESGDHEFWRGALFALLRREFGAGLGLSRAAVGANSAGGVNRALAVGAEIHADGLWRCSVAGDNKADGEG